MNMTLNEQLHQLTARLKARNTQDVLETRGKGALEEFYEARLPPARFDFLATGELALCWEEANGNFFLLTLRPLDPQTVDFGCGEKVRETWIGPWSFEYLSKFAHLAHEWLVAGEAGLRSSALPAGWMRVYP